MTTEDERWRSLDHTETFLNDLLHPECLKRIPPLVREMARRCLRHFPTTYERRVWRSKVER